MVIYVATVWAKPGHEAEVTKFYQELAPLLREAVGYRSRRMLRGKMGTMEAAVRKVATAQELAGHAEHTPPGTHFILIEEWDSVEQRLSFSRNASASRGKDLYPHILPEHTHEFFEDLT